MSVKRDSEAPPELDDRSGRRKNGLLTTGEMARRSGNTLRTVRFYEEAGLLKPLQRTDGGHRLFAESELHKLTFVSELRSAGLSLESIRHLLDVKSRCGTGRAASLELVSELERQIQGMQKQIELLSRMQHELTETTSLLAECGGCTSRQHYPAHCGECEVMTGAPQIPNSVRVLWGVSR